MLITIVAMVIVFIHVIVNNTSVKNAGERVQLKQLNVQQVI